MERNIKVEAMFIVKNNATIRRAAEEFGVSKTRIHKDVTEDLKLINPKLYAKVRRVLDKNKAERHIRGGKATQEKYRKLKENN